MINIKVRLFAAFKELIGKNVLDFTVEEGSSVRDVALLMEKNYPDVKNILQVSKYAVNQEYADAGKKLSEGDEITVIMPVSGGIFTSCSGNGSNFNIKITPERIDCNEVLDFVSDSSAGSVLLFNGTVRDNEDGKPVEYLYYEAYQEMAVKEIKKLINEAFSKYNISKVCIAHRTGKMEIGEISISIGVSSPHREDSYLASKFLIDAIKETVPIWKKEIFEEGGKWKRI